MLIFKMSKYVKRQFTKNMNKKWKNSPSLVIKNATML